MEHVILKLENPETGMKEPVEFFFNFSWEETNTHRGTIKSWSIDEVGYICSEAVKRVIESDMENIEALLYEEMERGENA